MYKLLMLLAIVCTFNTVDAQQKIVPAKKQDKQLKPAIDGKNLIVSNIKNVPVPPAYPAPDKLYGQLFIDVQLGKIFPDGKTFVDCVPKRKVGDIMYDYGMMKGPKFDVKKFVLDNFDLPPSPPALNYVQQEKDIAQHIKNLWPILKREADKKLEGSSLLPLPYAYIVPGGRFREIYYWDSYFTMLGLKENGEVDMIENMIKNFAYLINTYGHIPNGNRSYYLSRSQPPFFSMMVQLLASIKGDVTYTTYLPQLEKEYNYWMDKTANTQHVVKMPDGSLLNRYYDRDDVPRQESYLQDVEVAEKVKGGKEMLRNLRSGAESGWDFSSRWFVDEKNITTIQTTNIIPVDLNCLLYNLENVIAKAKALNKDELFSNEFKKKAAARKAAILKYCWNKTNNFFCDYNISAKKTNDLITAAGLFPLFVNLASKEQAAKLATVTNTELLKDGGIVTTNNHTGQQWDAPNGWAPLQWIGVKGLLNYKQDELAKKIAQRWVSLNEKVYLATGKLMEKYNVEDISKEAGGGEYPGQDGFGWTNGVYLALKKILTQ